MVTKEIVKEIKEVEDVEEIVEQNCGVYTVIPVDGKKAIKIKQIDVIKLGLNKSINDTLIERYEIAKNVFGEIYACNILDKFLISNKKLPILYINVKYELSLKSILLLRMFLYFDIQMDIKSKKELINYELSGEFTIEAKIQEKQIVLDELDSFPGREDVLNKLKSLTTNVEMVEVISNLIEVENEELKKRYEEEFKYFTIPKNVISLRDYKFVN